MTSAANSVRALLVYVLILPMALIMGYLLASPTEFGAWAMIGVVLLVLASPLILTRHHAVLFLTWNMTAMAFFLPGQPPFWLVMAGISLLISVFQRALSKEMRFISVPSLTWPLVFLVVVIMVTAKFTGGMGLRLFGSENVGGKRYFWLLAGIAGFFAMIAHPIPAEKATRYTGLFFLGALINTASTLLPFLGPAFYFLFLFFPSDAIGVTETGFDRSIFRLWGTSIAAMSCFFYVLARYGVRETLSLQRPLRPILLLALLTVGSSGGFRSFFILMVLTFALVFYLEGLFKSRYTISLACGVVLVCATLVPLANRLPLSIQRALSVLPLNISPIARYDAAASSEWRLEMWRTVLPQVPEYLWFGKGLGISRGDLELVSEMSRRGRVSSQELSILAGDYHNGPLSVLIPFGIWGAIGLVWFFWASVRALYRNYLYGDPELSKVNTLLLAYFIARIILFCLIFGGFYGDLPIFVGIVGLSIALNHGIRKPAVQPSLAPAAEPLEIVPPGLAQPSFSRAR